jgi:hypothetical protein
MELSELYRFLIGLLFIFIIIGMYQSIYLLNKHISSKSKQKKTIEDDIKTYGTCCGNTESCTLDAKIRQMDIILTESLIETSAGGKTEKVEE